MHYASFLGRVLWVSSVARVSGVRRRERDRDRPHGCKLSFMAGMVDAREALIYSHGRAGVCFGELGRRRGGRGNDSAPS